MERVSAFDRVATSQGTTERQAVFSERDMSGKRHVGGECVVEVAKRIGRKADARQEIPKLAHLRGAQTNGRPLKIREGAVKELDAGLVAAPMKRLVADDVLQGLRHHYAFHRVKAIGGQQPLLIDCPLGNEACGIPKVPTQPV